MSNDTQTLTLTDFLLARIAEDEEVARAAQGRGSGVWTRDGGMIYDGHETNEVVDWVYDDGWDHIARHDPARVLAECEAKRRIVDLHPVTVRREWRSGLGERIDYEVEQFECEQCGWVGEMPPHDGWTGTTGCDTLRALALAYADHPDYRDEWRP